MAKILVIDDSDIVSKLLRDGLTEAGYEVALAADADSGYRKAVEIQPDLILLDVQLPDVTGFELLRVLRNRPELERVPVIMVTGTHHQVDHRVKGFQTGADDYVLKPFEMPELLERIRVQLRRAQSNQRPYPVTEFPAPAEDMPPEVSGQTAALTLPQAIGDAVLQPTAMDGTLTPPRFALFYLLMLEIVTLGAMGLAAGPMPKPILVGAVIPLVWAILWAVLMVTTSFLGVSLNGREASRLLSISALPIGFKMLGALIFAGITALPPFYFTADPSLVLPHAPQWLGILDLFSLWAAFLLACLLRARAGGSWRKTGLVSGVVWVAGSGIALLLTRMMP